MTARSLGMGGAFASLGGDLSAAFLNPAGLGVYRKSELTLYSGIRFCEVLLTQFWVRKGRISGLIIIFGGAGFVSTYNSNKDKRTGKCFFRTFL